MENREYMMFAFPIVIAGKWQRKFPALQYLVCPKRALFVGTRFLILSLMFYYDNVDEWRGIQYTYISLLYYNCFTIIHQLKNILYVFISKAMQKCIHISLSIFQFLRCPVNYLAFQSVTFDDYSRNSSCPLNIN
jgi:hypothetical protein